MFNRKKDVPAPSGTGPAISLDKVPPGLVSLTKTAAVSLEKQGLTGQRAAVYLVLDHSGSMVPYYQDGSMQRLAEQALGLSANMDDDGCVPLIYFGSYVEHLSDIDLDSYQGVVDRTHNRVHWGSTNYAAAINYVIEAHDNPSAPALVIFQTDGDPDSRQQAESAIRTASEWPIFFSFVGFGPARNMRFLKKLDDLKDRTVDNASFFHAADPHAVSDAALYDGITHEYAGWLAAASAAGVLR
ncbi:toxic cation resistance protein [Streptomyces venezuelae]|uniref:Toxic cation resistance protein n=1 Tax=Streptomyces venezuelae TaxID=54571 RepID=A0A5P2CT69_STRVZ|nr:VWA domain-containing protein [Streptomyces venezuelae]QES45197.1 toxic cation resistance protein [Streptomyces venezuelae]